MTRHSPEVVQLLETGGGGGWILAGRSPGAAPLSSQQPGYSRWRTAGGEAVGGRRLFVWVGLGLQGWPLPP